jgi:cell division protein FtsL
MKSIRIWKLVMLVTITFGIYALYWFIRTRNELVVEHKQQLPHWLLLMLPPVIAALLTIPIMVVLITANMADVIPPSNIALVSYSAVMAIVFIPFFVTVWWMWKFSKAIEVATNGRMPANWGIALYIFVGPYVAIPQILYMDQMRSHKKENVSERVKPSSRFIVYSTITIVLSSIVLMMTSLSIPQDIKELGESINQTTREVEAFNKRVEDEALRYEACVDDLNETYPGEITEGQESGYSDGYNKCEKIRIERERFIDNS